MIYKLHSPIWLTDLEWSHHGIYISLSYGLSLFLISILVIRTYKRLKHIQYKLSQIEPKPHSSKRHSEKR